MSLSDPSNPRSLSYRFRQKRDLQVRALIEAVGKRHGRVRILDLGGTPQYWRRVGVDFLRQNKADVAVVNLNPVELAQAGADDDVLRCEVGDACNLSYADGSFDLCHSNSVIEHVVTWSNMRAFARETRRVAPNYYMQTPNFWFPIDPHYHRAPMFHWLPRPTRAALLRNFAIATGGRIADVGKSFDVVDGARLLTRGQIEYLFPDADIRMERVALLPKSIVASRLAG